MMCRLAESARRAEVARQEAAAKAAEYEKAAMEELEYLRAKRAAAKKVGTRCSCASACIVALVCHCLRNNFVKCWENVCKVNLEYLFV